MQLDSARLSIDELARRHPNDTGVLGLVVRINAAERKFAAATDALRRRDSLAGRRDPGLLAAALGAALGDADGVTVAAALDACGRRRVDTAYAWVVDRLHDELPGVRAAACLAVARYGRDDAAGLLAGRIFDSHPVITALLDAAVVLGDTTLRRMTTILQFHESDLVRWRLIVAHAALGDRRMVRRLREAAGSDVEGLAVEAAAALARVGEPGRLSVLFAGLRSADEFVRGLAAERLGWLQVAGAADSLLPMAGDSATSVRRAVAVAFGDIGDATADEAVRRLAADPDAGVRSRAVVAAARLGLPDAETIAGRLLADPEPAPRAAALAVLLSLAATPQAAQADQSFR